MNDAFGNFEVAVPVVVAARNLVGAQVGLHLPPLRLDHVVPRRVGQSGSHLRGRFKIGFEPLAIQQTNLQNLWRNVIYCGGSSSTSVVPRVGGAYRYVLGLAPPLLLVLLKLGLLVLLLLPLLLLLSLKTLLPVQELPGVRSRRGGHLLERGWPEMCNRKLHR